MAQKHVLNTACFSNWLFPMRFYPKLIYVIGATACLCCVLTYVMTNNFKPPRNINEMSTPHMVSPYHTAETPKTTNTFDVERLQAKFKNESCPIRTLTLINYTAGQNTGLVSFPASGNTWTRHLIQQLSGLLTCGPAKTVVQRKFIPVDSFHTKACIVYKSHHSAIAEMKFFSKAVILIRNPLYALKSSFHYKHVTQKNKTLSGKVNKHTGYADTALFNSYKWTEHVARLQVWRDRYIAWMETFKHNCLIVVYEHLKENVASELLRIARFLEIQFSPKDFWCTLVNKEGDCHRISRNKSETSLSNLFTARQKKRALKAVCDVMNVARNLDIELDISQYIESMSETPGTTCL